MLFTAKNTDTVISALIFECLFSKSLSAYRSKEVAEGYTIKTFTTIKM